MAKVLRVSGSGTGGVMGAQQLRKRLKSKITRNQTMFFVIWLRNNHHTIRPDRTRSLQSGPSTSVSPRECPVAHSTHEPPSLTAVVSTFSCKLCLKLLFSSDITGRTSNVLWPVHPDSRLASFGHASPLRGLCWSPKVGTICRRAETPLKRCPASTLAIEQSKQEPKVFLSWTSLNKTTVLCVFKFKKTSHCSL